MAGHQGRLGHNFAHRGHFFATEWREPGWPGEPGLTPLVLAHGFGVDLTMWDWQLEPLSWRRRLILWDARGHGAPAQHMLRQPSGPG